MSIIKRNGAMFPTIPALFDDFFSHEPFNWRNSNFSSADTTLPSVNIKETPENFTVEVAAPGMDKKDFRIMLEGNTLTIVSESDRNEDQNHVFARREFSYQSFTRTFVLPKDVVNESGISAKYEHGILYLTIPKKEEAKQKPPRLIEIH